MNERQTQDMTRAAERFAEAARELTSAVDRLSSILERQEERKPGETLLSLLGSGGLPEEEANRLAHEVVHEVRAELWADRKPERGPITPEEAEVWRRRRDERRAEGA